MSLVVCGASLARLCPAEMGAKARSSRRKTLRLVAHPSLARTVGGGGRAVRYWRESRPAGVGRPGGSVRCLPREVGGEGLGG